ncbi:MAG: transcriptional regulator [Methanobrevibacter sp.]|nr:transcriptional regulator [Methanobrevibacter sp.]
MDNSLDDETLKKLAYVSVSTYRVKAIKSLQDGQVKIPTKIAEEAGIRSNHISKVLTELKDIGAAECINEEARKGRLYRLTGLGEEISHNLDE